MVTFGERLKMLRDEADETQEQVGDALGFVKSTVCQWETDNRVPASEVLRRLADHYRVSVDFLIGYSDFRDSADRISGALKDDPELAEFWNHLRRRDNLKLLFKQVHDLSDDSIKRIMRVVRAIEAEETQ